MTDTNPKDPEKLSSAYETIRDAFDKALDAPRGVRIPCLTRGAALSLRHRFNYFRKLNRDQNSDIYPSGHRMHKRSVYDSLVLRIPAKGAPDDNVLFIEPHLLGDLIIEEIQ